MSIKQGLKERLGDLRSFPGHASSERLLDELAEVKASLALLISEGDTLGCQMAFSDLEEIIKNSRRWSAAHRKQFLQVYVMEFSLSHSWVAQLGHLPIEVDKRIVQGFGEHPRRLSEKDTADYIAALIDRARYPLVAKLMDIKLSFIDPSNPSTRFDAPHNPAHGLHEFSRKISWDYVSTDKLRPLYAVYAKHEDLIVAAIAEASEDALYKNWASNHNYSLITTLYQNGAKKLAEQLFQLNIKHYWSDEMVKKMVETGQMPDVETCRANAIWADETKNPYYLTAMIDLHLATGGKFPLLVDPSHKELESHGWRMNQIIVEHGALSPALAGNIAVKYLEGCPGADGFFRKALPKAILERHPLLLEGSLQADLGL